MRGRDVWVWADLMATVYGDCQAMDDSGAASVSVEPALLRRHTRADTTYSNSSRFEVRLRMTSIVTSVNPEARKKSA